MEEVAVVAAALSSLQGLAGRTACRDCALPLLLKPGTGQQQEDGDKLGFPVFPLQREAAEAVNIFVTARRIFSWKRCKYVGVAGWNLGTEQEIFSMDGL